MSHHDTWHIPSDVIARFVDEPTRLDAATGSSVETHLVACRPCREQLNSLVDQVWLDASWERVADLVDQPRRTMLERLLDRAGVASGPARLISSTPGLRTASVAAVAVLTALAVLATRQAESLGPFLTFAPLVPLAAISITFAPVSDPIGEAGTATALNGPRLTLIRVATALATSLLVLVVGGRVVTQFESTSFLWVVPGLALALGSLALGTWFPVERATAGLAAAWLVTVAGAWRLRDIGEPLADTPLFAAPGQLLMLTMVVLGGVILGARIDRYSTLGVH